MTLAVKVAYSGRWGEICGVDGLVNEEAYVYRLRQFDVLSRLSINPGESWLFKSQHDVCDGSLVVKMPEMGILDFRELSKMYGGGI